MRIVNDDIREGDIVTVQATGRKRRKVVSAHGNFVMVERNWKDSFNKHMGPAKIWTKQITNNFTGDERCEAEELRFELRQQFLDDLPRLKEFINELVAA